MIRKEFGRLVAMIRTDLGWTQAQLAEYADLDDATLSNIERGAKKNLEPATLFSLANALELTTLERKEFFLASCGLDQKQIVRQPSINTPTDVFDASKTLKTLFCLMSAMQVPTHLGDIYGDVVAVNQIVLELLSVNATVAKLFSKSGVRLNNLQLVFDRKVKKVTEGNFSPTALGTLRAFREGGMRYRTKPRYAKIMRELRNKKKYPLFDKYWRKVSTIEDDKESAFDSGQFHHPLYGDLRFHVSASPTSTPYGELFLSHATPLDRHTAVQFNKIAEKVGNKTVQLSSWPLKE